MTHTLKAPTDTLKTISPVDGRIYVERPLQTAADIDRALDAPPPAQRHWAALPLATRCDILTKAVDAFVAQANDIATEITWQMGRPCATRPAKSAASRSAHATCSPWRRRR